MKFYDIGKELFSADVYPGDPVPSKEPVLEIGRGDECNLTRFSMGSHSGTHLDAPKHFIKDGDAVDEIPLEKCLGECKVVNCRGAVNAEKMEMLLEDGSKKILLKGEPLLTPDAASCMAAHGLELIGVEAQTVGMIGITQNRVHEILLQAGIVVVEGLVLTHVPEGRYFLAAQPLRMAGLDGSPVRPVLVDCDR